MTNPIDEIKLAQQKELKENFVY